MPKWAKKWRGKQERMRQALRGTYVHRLFGERIFHPHIWEFDINSLAGGFSLGLFLSFTPTIPFHMLLCAVFSILLRVNLPISLAACWVTNPLTAVPIYLAEHQLGRCLLEHSRPIGFMLNIFGFETKALHFMEHTLYLWVGSLIFSVAAAVAGNIAFRAAWLLSRRLKEKIAHHGQIE